MVRKIIDYLPHVLREYREVKGIADGQQWLFDNLWDEVDKVFNDQYLDTATANGISRWEKILKIVPKGSDTLEVRRTRIKSKINFQLPYTLRALYTKIQTLDEEEKFEIQIEPGTYTLFIKTFWDKGGQIDALKPILTDMVPVNISIISTNEIHCTPPPGNQAFVTGMTACEMINISDAGKDYFRISADQAVGSIVTNCSAIVVSDVGHEMISSPAESILSAGVTYAQQINISE